MRQIIWNVTSNIYDGNQNQSWNFNVWAIGSQSPSLGYFLTVTIKECYTNKITAEWTVELKTGGLLKAENTIIQPQQAQPMMDIAQYTQVLTQLFDKAIGVKKEEGVWTPKFAPGDTVIVDRPGASEVKILDPQEQAYEKVQKRALTVEKDGCRCPMRQVITLGCPKMRGAKECLS